ncbi:MAG TPA: PIG-L family deacetylase [Candidatus Angelobacter sp.]|nr:PIG-L family deacetylase [Candidatus Angelobacter sp.]
MDNFYRQTLLSTLLTNMEHLQPLLGTTVMLVAHPDDEVIAFAGLMQRMKKAVVVFATDGAPRDSYFWKEHGSRDNYAEVRRQEARKSLEIVGTQPVFLFDQVEGGIIDQELFRRLPEAIKALEQVLDRIAADSLLTLAYEGGHPDHDACSFICRWVAGQRKLPTWESPLYHCNPDGSGVVQVFPQPTGQEVHYSVEGEALEKKLEMFHTYKSQKLVLDGFRPEIEQFRPMADYDFTQRPLPWKLNYELWQWPMTGEDVSQAFASYLGNGNF